MEASLPLFFPSTPSKTGTTMNECYKYFRNECFFIALELKQSFKSGTQIQNYLQMLIANYLDLAEDGCNCHKYFL